MPSPELTKLRIPHYALTVSDLPSPSVTWDEMTMFAASFDVCAVYPQHEAHEQFAVDTRAAFARDGLLPDGLTMLRTALSLDRHFPHFDNEYPGDPNDMRYANALVGRIRSLVVAGAHLSPSPHIVGGIQDKGRRSGPSAIVICVCAMSLRRNGLAPCTRSYQSRHGQSPSSNRRLSALTLPSPTSPISLRARTRRCGSSLARARRSSRSSGARKAGTRTAASSNREPSQSPRTYASWPSMSRTATAWWPQWLSSTTRVGSSGRLSGTRPAAARYRAGEGSRRKSARESHVRRA